jgi:hypothetical protein
MNTVFYICFQASANLHFIVLFHQQNKIRSDFIFLFFLLYGVITIIVISRVGEGGLGHGAVRDRAVCVWMFFFYNLIYMEQWYLNPACFLRQVNSDFEIIGLLLVNRNSHIDHRMQKATLAFWQCQRVIGQTWGLKPKVVYWTYAVLLWWKKVSLISVNRKTAHLQRLVCVSITGSMHSTPIAALEVILMLPPLGIFILRERQERWLKDWIVLENLLEQDLAIRRLSKRWLMSGHLFWPHGTRLFLLLLLEEGF